MVNENNNYLLSINKSYSYIDILFWICIILYLDPAGITSSLGNIRMMQPLLLVIIWILYILSSKSIIYINNYTRKIQIFFFIFFIYYMFIFLYLQDSYSPLSFTEKLLKTRLVFTSWLLFLPVTYFIAYKNNRIFLKLFSISAIIIGLLLIIEINFHPNLIDLNTFNRGFFNAERYLMKAYGILEFGLYIPFALGILPYRSTNNDKKLWIAASLFIFLIYFLSLTRRYFIFITIAAMLSYVLSKYFFNKTLIKKSTLLIYLLCFAFMLYSSFSEQFFAMIESFNTLYSGYGTTHRRLSLYQHTSTINMISDNLWIGSGYINEWYTNNTFSEQRVSTDFGLAGADYLFLSSIGMYGIIGVLIFTPVYYFLIKFLLNSISFIKENIYQLVENINLNIYPLILFLSAYIFFFKHIISYPNWFSFIGPTAQAPKYYIILGILFGAFQKLVLNLKFRKVIK